MTSKRIGAGDQMARKKRILLIIFFMLIIVVIGYSLLPPHVRSPEPVRVVVKNQDVNDHIIAVELLDNGKLVYNISYYLKPHDSIQDTLPRKGKAIRIKLDGDLAATKTFGWGWVEMHIIVVSEGGKAKVAIGGKVS